MRIGVLGAGSIGTLFGSLLFESGNDVVLYNRNQAIVSAVRKRGVRLVQPDGRTVRSKTPIEVPPRTLRGYDLVIVTVKAYDSQTIAGKYSGTIGKDCSILTIQNGLGNFEALSRGLGAGKVLAGSTSEAALTLEPGVIAHTGRGKTWVGEFDGRESGRVEEIVKEIRGIGLSVELTGNIRGVLWGKAIVNSAINPVTALTRLRNGEVRRVKGLLSLMERTIGEGESVARAENVKLQPLSPLLSMNRILRATAENRSSMLQDVELGRRTEIEQLNGVIVKTARRAGVLAPTSEILLGLVRALQSSYLRAGS